MGELYLDKIDIFLMKEFQLRQDRFNLKEAAVKEEHCQDNLLPALGRRVESPSESDYTCAS